jgi:hypothetical protein
MKKLKLDLDAMDVESFPTLDNAASERGTVLGHTQPNHTCTIETHYDQTCHDTCAATCDPLRFTCGRTCIWTE